MSNRTRWLPGFCLSLVVMLLGQTWASAADDISPTLAGHLKKGKVNDAEEFLQKRLTADPKHSQARFALGVVKFLSAVEKLGQDQYRYGALNGTVRNLPIPILRLPTPQNPKPETVTYQQVRQIFADFQTELMQADAELEMVDLTAEVKLPLDLMEIRLEINGDGTSSDNESFEHLLRAVNQTGPNGVRPDLHITFDNGDVPWLRGYCHFLAAFCDMVLAYDHQRLFDHTGQLIYPRRVPSEAAFATLDSTSRENGDAFILDLIAAIHLMNFPVKEPARMESARKHLLTMIQTSRQSWKLIQAETDNNREWLPNPKQTGVLRIPVTQDVIDGWQGVLTEMEDLLEGRKLVPFWRDYVRVISPGEAIPAEGRGVNLKRFFAEPRDFDLILLIQGSGALPYVEQGKLSRPETWDNLTRVFRGQFFGFAMWFN